MKEIEYWIYTIAVIIGIGACAISGAVLAVTGDTPNLGLHKSAESGEWIINPATPSPLSRPIGEMLGMEKDAEGHWSRAR